MIKELADLIEKAQVKLNNDKKMAEELALKNQALQDELDSLSSDEPFDMPAQAPFQLSQLDRIVRVLDKLNIKASFINDILSLTTQDAVFQVAEVNKYYKILGKLIGGWDGQEPILQCISKDTTQAVFVGMAHYPGAMYSLHATFMAGVVDPNVPAGHDYYPFFLGEPTNAQHAATKGYTDGKFSNIKATNSTSLVAIDTMTGATPETMIASVKYTRDEIAQIPKDTATFTFDDGTTAVYKLVK